MTFGRLVWLVVAAALEALWLVLAPAVIAIAIARWFAAPPRARLAAA